MLKSMEKFVCMVKLYWLCTVPMYHSTPRSYSMYNSLLRYCSAEMFSKLLLRANMDYGRKLELWDVWADVSDCTDRDKLRLFKCVTQYSDTGIYAFAGLDSYLIGWFAQSTFAMLVYRTRDTRATGYNPFIADWLADPKQCSASVLYMVYLADAIHAVRDLRDSPPKGEVDPDVWKSLFSNYCDEMLELYEIVNKNR